MPQNPLLSNCSKLLQLPLLQPRSQLIEVANQLELAIAVWDLQRMQVRFSNALAHLYGFEAQGFEPNSPNSYDYGHFLDCVYLSDRPHVQTMIQTAVTCKQKFAVDYRITNVAGQIVWLSSQGHIFERNRDAKAESRSVQALSHRALSSRALSSHAPDAYSSSIELIEVIQDVTPRYQSRSALAANNAQWNALLEKSDELLIQADEEACIFWMSPASQRLLGYLPEGLVGERFLDLIHPDEVVKVQHAFESLGETQVPQTFQHSLRQRSGDYLPVQSTLRLGEELGCFAVLSCREITARLDVQSALDSTYAAYIAIVDQVTDLVFRFLPDGTITYGNQSFWKYFKRSPEQGIGLNFYRDLLFKQSAKTFLTEDQIKHCCDQLTPKYPTVTDQYSAQSGRRIQQHSYRLQALFNSEHALLEYQIIMSVVK